MERTGGEDAAEEAAGRKNTTGNPFRLEYKWINLSVFHATQAC